MGSALATMKQVAYHEHWHGNTRRQQTKRSATAGPDTAVLNTHGLRLKQDRWWTSEGAGLLGGLGTVLSWLGNQTPDIPGKSLRPFSH